MVSVFIPYSGFLRHGFRKEFSFKLNSNLTLEVLNLIRISKSTLMNTWMHPLMIKCHCIPISLEVLFKYNTSFSESLKGLVNILSQYAVFHNLRNWCKSLAHLFELSPNYLGKRYFPSSTQKMSGNVPELHIVEFQCHLI